MCLLCAYAVCNAVEFPGNFGARNCRKLQGNSSSTRKCTVLVYIVFRGYRREFILGRERHAPWSYFQLLRTCVTHPDFGLANVEQRHSGGRTAATYHPGMVKRNYAFHILSTISAVVPPAELCERVITERAAFDG